MSTAEIVAMLEALGAMFGLGSKLVDAAKQKHPVLHTDAPPELTEYEASRQAALKRIGGGA